MPLATTGPLSLLSIQTEFGGSAPISMSEYYAGGGNVPSGASGTNGAVPTSGSIDIAKFRGTQKTTGPMSVTVSPNEVYADAPRNNPTATSDATTATVTGGTGPYSYVWTRVSGSVGSPTASTSATTAFTASLSQGDNTVSTFRCTVTDSLGATASGSVICNFQRPL